MTNMKKNRTQTQPDDRPGPLLIYNIGGKLVAKTSRPNIESKPRHPAAVDEATWQAIREHCSAARNDPEWTEEKAHAQEARCKKSREKALSLTQKRSKPQTGKVGIFWVFKGQLLAATCALREGQEYGDAINGLTDHVKYWPVFQKLHPELRSMEYQEVPRGRVLFMKPARRFYVYMDKVLHNSKTKSALLKEFELSFSRTNFLTDPHYTTDPEELNAIFA